MPLDLTKTEFETVNCYALKVPGKVAPFPICDLLAVVAAAGHIIYLGIREVGAGPSTRGTIDHGNAQALQKNIRVDRNINFIRFI